MATRSPFFALPACVISGCASVFQASSFQSRLMQACERLVDYYPVPRDSLDGQAYGNMFTEDGEFVLRGVVTKGRQNIVKQLLLHASNAATRHLTGSVNVKALSKDVGVGVSYALVFSSDSKPITQLKELDEHSLLAVVSYQDKFKFEDGECFFSQRSVIIDFLNTKNNDK